MTGAPVGHCPICGEVVVWTQTPALGDDEAAKCGVPVHVWCLAAILSGEMGLEGRRDVPGRE